MIASMAGLIALAAMAGSAVAQEGCKTSQLSCSQISADCTKKCQSANSPSACEARLCTVPFSTCKANGVWKSVASPACWKTNNRS
ncbi:hypothetical protein AXW83_24725 [Bosea sp. PAMC 26642]|nr:hypothetical protein AXW83_24725 [Bosea sp. PAMC 26642]